MPDTPNVKAPAKKQPVHKKEPVNPDPNAHPAWWGNNNKTKPSVSSGQNGPPSPRATTNTTRPPIPTTNATDYVVGDYVAVQQPGAIFPFSDGFTTLKRGYPDGLGRVVKLPANNLIQVKWTEYRSVDGGLVLGKPITGMCVYSNIDARFAKVQKEYIDNIVARGGMPDDIKGAVKAMQPSSAVTCPADLKDNKMTNLNPKKPKVATPAVSQQQSEISLQKTRVERTPKKSRSWSYDYELYTQVVAVNTFTVSGFKDFGVCHDTIITKGTIGKVLQIQKDNVHGRCVIVKWSADCGKPPKLFHIKDAEKSGKRLFQPYDGKTPIEEITAIDRPANYYRDHQDTV